jgi:hypothetical protein
MAVIWLYDCGCSVSRMGQGPTVTGVGFCEAHIREAELELARLAGRVAAICPGEPTLIDAELMGDALERAIELGGERVIVDTGELAEGVA